MRARAKVPLKPQLATLVDEPPEGGEWIHELKYDGYRIIARVSPKSVTLWSRNGNDWTAKLKTVAAGIAAAAPEPGAVLDGELVAYDSRGRTDFQTLQNALHAGDAQDGGKGKLSYVVFDLLSLGGKSVTELPLRERRKLIESSLKENPVVKLSPILPGTPARALERACSKDYEGIVSKRADAPYVHGRTRYWLKTKCGGREEFVIIGYTGHRKSAGEIGALLLGIPVAKNEYLYCGRVGTGFSDADRRRLFRELSKARRRLPRVINEESLRREDKLVEPSLVAEVRYTEWTNDYALRHPSFLGVREDKPVSAVTLAASSHPLREVAVRTKSRARSNHAEK